MNNDPEQETPNSAQPPQTTFTPQSADNPTTDTVDTAPLPESAPDAPESVPMPTPVDSDSVVPLATPPKKRSIKKLLGCILIALVLLAGIAYAAYRYGNNRGYNNGKNAQATAMTAAGLKVPDGATMISQCTAGEGTQYVLPKNIPQGPIYNMWNNKVTGIEYMLGQSEIAKMTTQNLALMGQNYNHIDVMYEAAGHAGFTEPHYHIILSLIPYDQEQKITCGSNSPSSAMSM